MKRISVISLVLMLSAGCGKYLDQYPGNAVSADRITTEHAELMVTGMYNIAQYKPTFNGWALFDLIGGDIVRTGATSVNTPKLMVESAIAPDKSLVTSPWNGYFAGLYQINTVISLVEKLPASQRKDELLGTGCFFRALYYYNIVTRWRNVPVITGEGGENCPQQPEEEVWKFIESELVRAVGTAPDFSDKNYVSKQAAQALLARTYLAMGRKEDAARLAESLISDETFELSDFRSIFRGGENKEEIFSFANIVHESKVNMSSYYYTKESGVGGAYNFRPTAEAMTMYSETDSRKEISIAMQGNNEVMNKYCGGDAGTDPIYIVRLAEMYLISAECQGLEKGLQRLNELRIFRGLEPVYPSDEEEFLDTILHERRLELFGEGFRWYDLVRTGRYEEAAGVGKKYTVLPVPARELSLNGNLRQHPLWSSDGSI